MLRAEVEQVKEIAAEAAKAAVKPLMEEIAFLKQMIEAKNEPIVALKQASPAKGGKE